MSSEVDAEHSESETVLAAVILARDCRNVLVSMGLCRKDH